MRIRRIEGDGNCLFNSCGFQLGIDHVDLRQEIVDLMMSNPQFQVGDKTIQQWVEMTEPDYYHYVEQLQKDRSWGTGFELAIISVKYKRTIRIYRRCSKHPETRFHETFKYFPEFGNDINILFTKNHYDALLN